MRKRLHWSGPGKCPGRHAGERPEKKAAPRGSAPAAAREEGRPECRTQDRLRTGRATSEEFRERLNKCTGERPVTAQGSALPLHRGAPWPRHRGAPWPSPFAPRHPHIAMVSAQPPAASAQPPSQRRLALGFLKLFRNPAFRERLNTRAGERPAIPQPRGAPSCKTSSVGGASGCRRQRPLATAPGGPHALIEPGYLQARATAAIEARKRLQGTYDN